MNITIILLLLIISMSNIVQNGIASIEQMTPFVNKRLQQYVNNLFHYIKIQKGYRHYYKIKILLTMHHSLNEAIEFNWKIYSDIKKIVAVANNIPDNFIYNLVETALQNDKELYNTITGTDENSTEVNKLTKESEMENVKITETNKPTATHTDVWDNDILDKLYDKINNLTIDDLIGEPVNKTHLQVNKDTWYKPPTRINMDLQEWDPKTYSESFMRRRMRPIELVEKYPFVASIHVRDQFMCTGSIISNDAVITTASCLPIKMKHRMLHSITVRVGSKFPDKYGVKLPARYVEFHPRYEPRTLNNNLAIIRLTLQGEWKKLKNMHEIMKVKLDEGESPLRSVQVLGYGTGSVYLGDKRLAIANLEVLPSRKCTAIYSRKYVSKENFCTGALSEIAVRSTQCSGYIGAPAVADGFLVGLVMRGSPVCDHRPTVFTKISVHYRWIRYVIKQKWKSPPSRINTASPGYENTPPRFTRMYFEDTTSLPTKPNIIIHKQTNRIFDEIRDILRQIGDPFSLSPKIDEEEKKLLNDGLQDDEDPFKYLQEETQATPLYSHPLYNKSIIPVPDVHFSTSQKTTRITKFSRPDIGLPAYIPYEIIDNYIEDSDELDYYMKRIIQSQGIGGMVGRQRGVTRGLLRILPKMRNNGLIGRQRGVSRSPPYSDRVTTKSAVAEIARLFME